MNSAGNSRRDPMFTLGFLTPDDASQVC